VHVLLDIKVNFVKVLEMNIENERKLDFL